MISASADVGNARLSFYIGYIGSRLRNGRQLQHSRLLTDTELGEQRDLAVGELKGIMVRIWILQVDLSEPSHLVTDVVRFPLEQAQPKSRNLTLDFAFKHDLGARKKADSYLGFPNGAKPAGRGIPKFRRDQLISDLRRSGSNIVQTVVAHGRGAPIVQCPASSAHL
jgi:hypothetical protein